MDGNEARGLGIADVKAGVFPGNKSAVVEDLRAKGHIVAMAGDGVNDAPALAAADVGIAMGTGADIAMASAGMTLLRLSRLSVSPVTAKEWETILKMASGG